MPATPDSEAMNIVLVHGAGADGSGWPSAQRFMSDRAGATVVEVAGSHAVFVSQPGVVANLIVQAAKEA
jgi:hypothetical protein